jgi:hypothetical protein
MEVRLAGVLDGWENANAMGSGECVKMDPDRMDGFAWECCSCEKISMRNIRRKRCMGRFIIEKDQTMIRHQIYETTNLCLERKNEAKMRKVRKLSVRVKIGSEFWRGSEFAFFGFLLSFDPRTDCFSPQSCHSFVRGFCAFTTAKNRVPLQSTLSIADTKGPEKFSAIGRFP